MKRVLHLRMTNVRKLEIGSPLQTWPIAANAFPFLLTLHDNRGSTRRFLADGEDLLIFGRIEAAVRGFNIGKPDKHQSAGRPEIGLANGHTPSSG